MTQRITIRDGVLNKLQTLSGYNFPSAGTTEGIEREKLPAIIVSFATEQTEQEFSGTTRRLDLVVSVVVYSRGDIYELWAGSMKPTMAASLTAGPWVISRWQPLKWMSWNSSPVAWRLYRGLIFGFTGGQTAWI
ncbi:hypothetical protein ACJJIU_10090 [Microbulbifer sp. CnH-101-E]|uniref:hypothetical protein n=1 Tax=unclassified Microbulbifer TaxID=2619833 RepID=UPI0040396B0A